MKIRLETIDILRGVTIFLVVVAHSSDNFLSDSFLKNFRMPLFFILSGYLFNYYKYENKFSTLLINKFNLLIIPYFSYAIFGLLIWSLREMLILHNSVNGLDNIFSFLYGNGENIKLNTPIWFLNCLFFSTLYLYAIIKLSYKINRKILYILLLLISFIGIYLNIFFILPWNLDVAMSAILFMYIGYSLKNKFFLLKDNFKTTYLILAITLFLISNYINGSIDMNRRLYGNIVLFYTSGFSGSYILCWCIHKKFFDFFYIKKFFIEAGQHSIVILGFHLPIILIIQKVSILLTNYQINFLFSSCIAISICIMLSKSFKNNFLLSYFFKGINK